MDTLFSVETITPERATSLLLRNECNRPIKRNWIETMARAMERGEWKLNGEAIKVGRSGRLLDGQNRLHAIIKSGRAQQMTVVTGLDDDVFDTIDQGVKRTSADVFTIRGEKNAVLLSAATRQLLAIVRGGTFSAKFTQAQLHEALDDHSSLRMWTSRFCGSKAKAFSSSAFPAVLTLGFERHGEMPAQTFLDQVSSGTDLSAGTPALALRERLMQAKARNIDRLTGEVTAAFIIRSWNAHIAGKPLSLLRYRPNDDSFPMVK